MKKEVKNFGAWRLRQAGEVDEENVPRGLKPEVCFKGLNVRAKARTLQSAGLK